MCSNHFDPDAGSGLVWILRRLCGYSSGDYVTAMKEFRLLSEQARHMLSGSLARCMSTLTVSQRLCGAAQWYQMAAEHGESSAQNDLGTFYKGAPGLSRIIKRRSNGIAWQRRMVCLLHNSILPKYMQMDMDQEVVPKIYLKPSYGIGRLLTSAMPKQLRH